MQGDKIFFGKVVGGCTAAWDRLELWGAQGRRAAGFGRTGAGLRAQAGGLGAAHAGAVAGQPAEVRAAGGGVRFRPGNMPRHRAGGSGRAGRMARKSGGRGEPASAILAWGSGAARMPAWLRSFRRRRCCGCATW